MASNISIDIFENIHEWYLEKMYHSPMFYEKDKSRYENEILLAINMEWIYLDDNYLYISERGKEIAVAKSPYHIRMQLEDYISIVQPSWVKTMEKGKKSSNLFLEWNIKEILEKAKLLDSDNIESIEWWTRLKMAYYDEINAKKIENGLKAEILIYKNEHHLTGKKPSYVGDDSEKGYDIISYRESKKIFIEVKSSQSSLENMRFTLTKNQWQTSLCPQNIDRYFIFAYSFKDNKYLILKPSDIKGDFPIFPDETRITYPSVEIITKSYFKEGSVLDIEI